MADQQRHGGAQTAAGPGQDRHHDREEAQEDQRPGEYKERRHQEEQRIAGEVALRQAGQGQVADGFITRASYEALAAATR